MRIRPKLAAAIALSTLTSITLVLHCNNASAEERSSIYKAAHNAGNTANRNALQNSSSKSKAKVPVDKAMVQIRSSAMNASAVPVLSPKKILPKPIRLKIEVPCRAWVPPKVQPKLIVLCVHGLGLNSASYANLGTRLAKAGIGAFAVDVRGFGTWMKLEGKNRVDFDACLEDVVQALNTLHTAYPTKPVFIMGESMGGAIALRVTARHPELVAGLISSVPSGDRFHTTRNKLRVALNVMTLRMNKDIDVGTGVISDATDDLKLQTAWKNDPLNRMKLSAKELWQFQSFMNDNHHTAKEIQTTPVLMIVGMNDKLCKPKGTIDLYEEIKSEDKKMMMIKHGEHLIFEEAQCSPAVFEMVVAWLKTHANSPAEKY